MRFSKWMPIAIFASCFFAGRAGSECGVASIYWEGSQTANGERYRPDGISAAHKTLPFGTRVAVRDKRTGRSVMVRINDRGPFIDGRIIDLSRGAARILGILDQGLADVCTEVVTLGAGTKLPKLSHRVKNTAKYGGEKPHVKRVCRKRRHVVRRKRYRCKSISIPANSTKAILSQKHRHHSKHYVDLSSLQARDKAFAQIPSTPQNVTVASKKEEKPVFHELLGAAALVTFVSPLFESEPLPVPTPKPQHRHELLQKVVDIRFEKKLESLEEKMDRILGKMDVTKIAPAAPAPVAPEPIQPTPKTQEEPLPPPEPPKRIDASLKQRIDTLAKKIRLEANEPTDSGLPSAPPPENLRSDQGAGSPDKRFWINPEDEKRKTAQPIPTVPLPLPSPAPAKPLEKSEDPSALSTSQKLMMKRLADQLDSIERRLQHLETAPKPAPVAPAYATPPTAYAPPQKQKEQKIPRDVEAKIQQAPSSMQPDLRQRYREHMKKPCFFTDEESGEKIPCTMRSLLQ